MFVWQLWMALHTEQPQHPIFKLERRTFSDPSPLVTRILTDVLPLVVLVLMVFSAWLLALLFIGVLLLLLISSGVVYGLIAALGVSRDMAKYRANGRYDLVAMTPDGVFGVVWAVGANFLQRADSLGYLRWAMYRLYIAAFCMLVFALVFSAAVLNGEPSRYDANPFLTYLLPGLANALIWLGIHALDFTRSALTGTLIGWLAPTYTTSRRETHLLALALYLMLQIFTYLLFWVVGGQMFALWFSGAGAVLLNLLRLLLVVGIRELTLRGLWELLLWRLNISAAETGLRS
jgi:hypothetical protein